MSFSTDEVLSIVRDFVTDPIQVKAVTAALIAAEKEAKNERATAEPKTKKRLVVLIRGDAATRRAVEGGAWVVALPKNAETATLLDKVSAAVRCSNDALKRKRATHTIKTFARAMEWPKAKAIKAASVSGAQDFSIKTKTPVEVVVVEKEEM